MSARTQAIATSHGVPSGMRTAGKMKLAGFVARLILAGRFPQRNVVRRGIAWSLDLREAIDLSIFLTGYFQPRVVRAVRRGLPDADGCFVDVGANRGAMAIPVAKSRPTCRVVCVEPVNEMIGRLRAGLAMNPSLRGVEVVHAFLVADGGADANAVPKQVDASWNLLVGSNDRTESGAVALSTEGAIATTLDDLVDSLALTWVDVVKIDVDGFELDVLRGAQRTIRRCTPLLVMEWSPGSQRSQHVDATELVDLLKEEGYRARRIRRSGRSTDVGWEWLGKVRDGESRDVVFVPSHEADPAGRDVGHSQQQETVPEPGDVG